MQQKVQCNIENIVMITMEHLEMNQISIFNDPKSIDILLNWQTKSNYSFCMPWANERSRIPWKNPWYKKSGDP